VLIVKFPVIVVVVYVATSLVNKDEYIDSSFRGRGSCPKGGGQMSGYSRTTAIRCCLRPCAFAPQSASYAAVADLPRVVLL